MPDDKVIELMKIVHTCKEPSETEAVSLVLSMKEKPIAYDQALAVRDLKQATAESKKQNMDIMEYILYHFPVDKSARAIRLLMETTCTKITIINSVTH